MLAVIRNYITMHGHMNIKNIVLISHISLFSYLRLHLKYQSDRHKKKRYIGS